MKKIGLLMVLAIFIGTGILAQSSKDARMQRAKAESEHLAKELNLSDKQIEEKAEIDAEMFEHFEKIQSERKAIMEKREKMSSDSSAEDREALSKEMEALRTKQLEAKKMANEKFIAILSEEQKAAYKKMRTPTSVKKTLEKSK